MLIPNVTKTYKCYLFTLPCIVQLILKFRSLSVSFLYNGKLGEAARKDGGGYNSPVNCVDTSAIYENFQLRDDFRPSPQLLFDHITVFYQLHLARRLQSFLLHVDIANIIQSFVSSRLDECNVLYFQKATLSNHLETEAGTESCGSLIV